MQRGKPLTRRTRLQPGAEARKRAALTGSTLRQRSKRPARKQKDEQWHLLSEWIRLKFGCRCVLCGRRRPLKRLHAHHCYSRGAHGTLKLAEWNVLPLCDWPCHLGVVESKGGYDEAFKQVADRREAMSPDDLTYGEIRALLVEALDGEDSRRRDTQTTLG